MYVNSDQAVTRGVPPRLRRQHGEPGGLPHLDADGVPLAFGQALIHGGHGLALLQPPQVLDGHELALDEPRRDELLQWLDAVRARWGVLPHGRTRFVEGLTRQLLQVDGRQQARGLLLGWVAIERLAQS
jgi:hypothetical protein